MESIPLYVSANEFGLKRVVLDPDRNLRILLNDNTRHGAQSADPALRAEPLTYFHRAGPLGDVLTAGDPSLDGAQVAIIGLGVGCMAAYAEPGQHFTFYEIDPGVAAIASDPQYFTFLSECRGSYEIVVGDGLESLARAPAGEFDVIILDAFTSDVIPPHLVSADALQTYLSKLAPAGLLVFHITNVHVELQPALAALAADAGLCGLACADLEVTDAERQAGRSASHYVALARDATPLARLAENPRWTDL
ncbi:MAG: hypothetical protein GY778_23530 [bacterium]|nr:hypothetical protein [bacterium]